MELKRQHQGKCPQEEHLQAIGTLGNWRCSSRWIARTWKLPRVTICFLWLFHVSKNHLSWYFPSHYSWRWGSTQRSKPLTKKNLIEPLGSSINIYQKYNVIMQFHSSNRVLGGSLFRKKEPVGKSWVCELFTSTSQRIKELVPNNKKISNFLHPKFGDFFSIKYQI